MGYLILIILIIALAILCICNKVAAFGLLLYLKDMESLPDEETIKKYARKAAMRLFKNQSDY